MPRPTTKADLIQAANEQFAKLWTLIGEMSDEEPFCQRRFRLDGNDDARQLLRVCNFQPL